jgi:hypothetical protein
VIEDIEGATSEPTRRRHVVVLSGAVAIASLVLLFSWIAPPDLGMTRQAALPGPSASAGPVMTIVTRQPMILQSGPLDFRSGTTSPSGENVRIVTGCADGTQISRPYYLVFEGNGQVMTVPLDASPPPLPQFISVDRVSGWLTVSCATSTIRVPRMYRSR